MKRFVVMAGAVLALSLVPAALASGTLLGQWTTTVTGTKLLHGALNGKWAIKFAAGTYQTSENGRPVTHGIYTTKGKTITFSTAPGPYSCPTKGTYKFTLKGKTLTFRRIHDSTSGICIARVVILKHKFTKV